MAANLNEMFGLPNNSNGSTVRARQIDFERLPKPLQDILDGSIENAVQFIRMHSTAVVQAIANAQADCNLSDDAANTVAVSQVIVNVPGAMAFNLGNLLAAFVLHMDMDEDDAERIIEIAQDNFGRAMTVGFATVMRDAKAGKNKDN